MKKYVFIAKEDVMQTNDNQGKLPDLLKVMAKYGVVADYDEFVKKDNEEYQKTIDSLAEQLKNEFKLDDLEKSMMLALRNFKSKATEELKEENRGLLNQITAIKANFSDTVKAIDTVLEKQRNQ